MHTKNRPCKVINYSYNFNLIKNKTEAQQTDECKTLSLLLDMANADHRLGIGKVTVPNIKVVLKAAGLSLSKKHRQAFSDEPRSETIRVSAAL